MESEQRMCPNRACHGGMWHIQPDAAYNDSWQVVNVADGSAWTVVAIEPLCPRCGTELVAILDIEGRRAQQDARERVSLSRSWRKQ